MSILNKKQTDKIVIFIHGLENKPPKKLLKKWYLKSIEEGFEKHQYELSKFDFEVVYWADLLYTQPLDPNVRDEDHPLFLDEPYYESIETQMMEEASKFKRRVFDRIEKFTDGLFLSKNNWINVEYIFDLVVSRAFKDLHAYYRKNVTTEEKSEETAKKLIRKRLKEKLEEHKHKKIFLIAHSMGSIVAYDVLSNVSSKITVESFITIGSPLGLSMIKREIFKENFQEFASDTKLPTPENIKKAWHNFADLADSVAINYTLGDDYSPNSFGIAPVDRVVVNDYHFQGNKNPHKSFGYLRTKELVHELWEFLSDNEHNLEEKVKGIIHNIKEIFTKD